MLSLSSFALTTAACHLYAAASPIGASLPTGSLSLPILRRDTGPIDLSAHAAWADSKYERLHANFETNNGFAVRGRLNTSERLARRDSERKTFTTPFTSTEAIPTFYYAVIEVGSPPVQIHTDLDTGSYDFWITAKDCQGSVSGRLRLLLAIALTAMRGTGCARCRTSEQQLTTAWNRRAGLNPFLSTVRPG